MSGACLDIPALWKIKEVWRRTGVSLACPYHLEVTQYGIMNFMRQISPSDRDLRDFNLRAKFDFEGWISALEKSTTVKSDPEVALIPSGGSASPATASVKSLPTLAYSNLLHGQGLYTLDPLVGVTVQYADVG